MTERLQEARRSASRGLASGRWRQALRGQSVLELAIFMPLLLVFTLACIQFAVIFMTYVNVVNVTRDAARWVAIHPHVVDGNSSTSGSTIYTITHRLPAGLNSGALSLSITPACASLTSGKCTGRDTGADIAVTATYTITSHLFLPASFGWGSYTITIPSTLPTYTIHMQVEPA
ncbi:MAG: TadE family protein [Chloroflexota bacterium]